MTRRGFLAWAGVIAAGTVVAGLAVAGVPPVVAPMLRGLDADWTPVGEVGAGGAGGTDLSQAGTIVSSSYTRIVRDAYLPPAKQKTPIFIVCEGSDQFTVFDARCTHLGCPLSYSSDSNEFLCACHGAVYNSKGEVTEGPPPRPLDRYEWKVVDGVLYVGRLSEGQA